MFLELINMCKDFSFQSFPTHLTMYWVCWQFNIYPKIWDCLLKLCLNLCPRSDLLTLNKIDSWVLLVPIICCRDRCCWILMFMDIDPLFQGSFLLLMSEWFLINFYLVIRIWSSTDFGFYLQLDLVLLQLELYILLVLVLIMWKDTRLFCMSFIITVYVVIWSHRSSLISWLF